MIGRRWFPMSKKPDTWGIVRHVKVDVWGRGAVGGHWAIWPLARAPTWLASQNKAKDKPTRQDNNAQANTTSQHDKPTRQANTTRQHITHTTHTHAHTCPGQTHTTHMNIRPSATVVRRFPRSHWLKRGQLHGARRRAPVWVPERSRPMLYQPKATAEEGGSCISLNRGPTT